jgi:hypothetical protein
MGTTLAGISKANAPRHRGRLIDTISTRAYVSCPVEVTGAGNSQRLLPTTFAFVALAPGTRLVLQATMPRVRSATREVTAESESAIIFRLALE